MLRGKPRNKVTRGGRRSAARWPGRAGLRWKEEWVESRPGDSREEGVVMAHELFNLKMLRSAGAYAVIGVLHLPQPPLRRQRALQELEELPRNGRRPDRRHRQG